MLTQFPGFDMDMIPDLQKQAREQAIVDAEEEIRLEQEREAARIAEARRHPGTLSQEERMARVRGVGEKTIEQLKAAGYGTVEAIHAEPDVSKLAESTDARHQEGAPDQARGRRLPRGGEARSGTELDAERAASRGSPGLSVTTPERTCVGCGEKAARHGAGAAAAGGAAGS